MEDILDVQVMSKGLCVHKHAAYTFLYKFIVETVGA